MMDGRLLDTRKDERRGRVHSRQWMSAPQILFYVDIVTCVLFIIQDMQEGDQLCGCYGLHGPSIHRHSRSCNVSFQDLGNWKTRCSYLVASEMHQISQSDQATQTQWSQH
jgi:hypothetical protein